MGMTRGDWQGGRRRLLPFPLQKHFCPDGVSARREASVPLYQVNTKYVYLLLIAQFCPLIYQSEIK